MTLGTCQKDVTNKLGRFGTVKRGTYKGQDVAAKILMSQFLPEQSQKEFEREVAVMKSLHHPNIVQFVGASNVQGKLALITEFAPLGNLASVLAERLVQYNMKLVMLLEIARAIQFLHSNNIIHRDIKPLNVLVFSLEQKAVVHVKLTDFGTSKFVADAKMTMTMNTGTIKYMAPETLGRNHDSTPVLICLALRCSCGRSLRTNQRSTHRSLSGSTRSRTLLRQETD